MSVMCLFAAIYGVRDVRLWCTYHDLVSKYYLFLDIISLLLYIAELGVLHNRHFFLLSLSAQIIDRG